MREIEGIQTDSKSRPVFDVKIANCGELIPKTKAKGIKGITSKLFHFNSFLETLHCESFIFLFWEDLYQDFKTFSFLSRKALGWKLFHIS